MQLPTFPIRLFPEAAMMSNNQGTKTMTSSQYHVHVLLYLHICLKMQVRSRTHPDMQLPTFPIRLFPEAAMMSNNQGTKTMTSSQYHVHVLLYLPYCLHQYVFFYHSFLILPLLKFLLKP